MVGLKLKVDIKEIEKAIDELMDDTVDAIFAESQNNIISKEIIDEGTLLKSGIIQRKFLDKSIVYGVPYADDIEFGRDPGVMPSVESIKGWVRRKLNVRNDKQVNRIAWAISKDIENNGTQPRPFLQPAIEKIRLKQRI